MSGNKSLVSDALDELLPFIMDLQPLTVQTELENLSSQKWYKGSRTPLWTDRLNFYLCSGRRHRLHVFHCFLARSFTRSHVC